MSFSQERDKTIWLGLGNVYKTNGNRKKARKRKKEIEPTGKPAFIFPRIDLSCCSSEKKTDIEKSILFPYAAPSAA